MGRRLMEKEGRAAQYTPCFFTFVSRHWKLSATVLNTAEDSWGTPEPEQTLILRGTSQLVKILLLSYN